MMIQKRMKNIVYVEIHFSENKLISTDSNNSRARGYLPETIFVGVSYLPLDFCFSVVVLK